MEQLLPFLLIALAFVLLFILPARQRKRMAQRQGAMQSALRMGTPIVLTCGLHGTVAGLAEDTVDVEVAPGTVLRFARPAVLEVKATAGTGAIDLTKDEDR